MSNNALGAKDLQELEVERIHSEIQRNNAQRDRLRQTSIWPRLFASIVVIMTLVFAFLGFFTDFYQIAITDRNAVRSENEKLLATIKTLSNDVQKLSIVEEENGRLVKQLNSIWTAYESQAIHIERLRNRIVEVSPNVLNKTEGFGKDDISAHMTESALYDGLLVTWWGSNTPEAIVVMLIKNENGDLYAEGVDLGEAPLARVHRDWAASWELKEGHIKMTETLPSRGGVIDVDLSHIRPDGHWNAMRTGGAVSETGYAKVLFRPATSP